MGSYKNGSYHLLKLAKFPAPLEVWVVSYGELMNVKTCYLVSGPSRGMGGFLRNNSELCTLGRSTVSGPSRGLGGFLLKVSFALVNTKKSFRPLSRYGWFPTRATRSSTDASHTTVSVPSRGMGGFLPELNQTKKRLTLLCFRPLSRVGWGPTESSN